MSEAVKCQCQSPIHNHDPGKCANDATETDQLCKMCHDKAATEGMAAMNPLSEPIRNVASSVGTAAGIGGTFGVGAWLTPLPADHPFYALVGRVASEWSHFEHILDLTIWDLARWRTEGFTAQIAACITAQIGGIPGRCNAIVSLGLLRGIDDAILKQVRKLRGHAYPPADQRARMVHDAWFIEEPSHKPGAFRAMPNSDPRFGVQDIPESKFEDLFKQIAELQTRSTEIRNAISSALLRPVSSAVEKKGDP
jgi:hypothetical protein